VWLNEYETLDDARREIGRYVDRYHHRPHSGLDYRTPLEVRRTWEDLQEVQKLAAQPVNAGRGAGQHPSRGIRQLLSSVASGPRTQSLHPARSSALRVITGSTRGPGTTTYTALPNAMVEPFRLSEPPLLHARHASTRDSRRVIG
jgi:hypothetical protein